jgi:hypothetical protein
MTVKNLFVDVEKERFYVNDDGFCELYEDIEKYADYIQRATYNKEDLDYMRFFFFDTENGRKAHTYFMLKWNR